nr:VOC family protein [Sphingomonas sp. CDS-1]
MSRTAVTELGYIGFEVSSLSDWRDMAEELLGMEYVPDDDGARLRMDYWHQRIVLHEGSSDDLAYAGFRLSGPEDFHAKRRELEALGIPFEVATAAQAEERHTLELMRLEDPTGLPIELFHGPQVDRHAPIRPGRGMHGHFKVGNDGLGHMIIRERGMDASERFYREALGMRGSIEARLEVGNQKIAPMFMHCNPRGHSIAFGIPGFNKRIQHFMVEVDNLDDVGMAYELAKERGAPILTSIGRHQNDNMVSFYLQTPSGFFVEYGWGGTPALQQSEYNPRGDSWGHELLNPALLG